MRKIFLLVFILTTISIVLFSSYDPKNISWKRLGEPIIDKEDEYEIRFIAYKISLLSISKRDFEFVAKDSFDKRRLEIKKYKIEQSSDGVHPEYKLKIYQAKSFSCIYDALHEINDWKKERGK